MLKDITLGQYFPGDTVVHRLDPRTKLLMVIVYIVALFLAKWVVSYAVMLAFLVTAVAPAGCASILGNIRDYQKATHATILMVTHSMDEVAQLADRMLVLNEGTIEMSGTPHEVFSHAARLAEIGLSVPQVTALFLRLRELGVDVDPTTFTVEQAVPQLRALLEGRAHA